MSEICELARFALAIGGLLAFIIALDLLFIYPFITQFDFTVSRDHFSFELCGMQILGKNHFDCLSQNECNGLA